MNTNVHSLVQTASDLCENQTALLIPCYQRPYVWPSDDVVKLLDDIVVAHDAGDLHYYIGTVLTAVTQERDGSTSAGITYELIDGQQRMTTLMLLALVFQRALPGSALGKLAVLSKAPRLSFAIRNRVQALLGYWAGLDNHNSPGEEAIRNDPYLTNLNEALIALENRLSILRDAVPKLPDRLEKIADFVYDNVKWVNNVMPASMDLNRLFATTNTAGVQLEQSDILKARLLNKVKQNKFVYDAIWQACECMDNYFERNLRQMFPTAHWHDLKYEDLAEYVLTRFPLNSLHPVASRGSSIAQLAKDETACGETNKPASEDDDNEVYCTPIISFSLLLMHTFRIYRQSCSELEYSDVSVRLNEDRLNECFAEFVATADEAMVQDFIQCLWKVRYQFDTWVVKWVELAEDGDKQLRLSSVYPSESKGTSRLSRRLAEISNATQLQSVRNFTGERSAQYWLTPFLGKLIVFRPNERRDVEALLERIDNQLSLTNDTQKEASFALLSGDARNLRPMKFVCDYLKTSKGTGFEHYWFQKIEYVLWRERGQLDCFSSEKLEQFRITSKNSVEHVHPQHERHNNHLDDEYLNAFGNLVLLSPGENSSYGNKPVLSKWADFMAKPRYDSLKLAHLFGPPGNGEWNSTLIELHENAVIELLKHHYSRNYEEKMEGC